jgi:hypothetical protein
VEAQAFQMCAPGYFVGEAFALIIGQQRDLRAYSDEAGH